MTAKLNIANQGQDLPTSPDTLLQVLDNLGISYDLYHHRAVFTVEESVAECGQIPGRHCRNLFLRDKKKRNFLLVLPDETEVDLNKLPDIIGSARLSFGSAERLWECLGVRPGSVCPFSIINDTDHQVQIFLDDGMMKSNLVAYHPLLNTMTVTLKPEDLIKYIESTGHEAHIIEL